MMTSSAWTASVVGASGDGDGDVGLPLVILAVFSLVVAGVGVTVGVRQARRARRGMADLGFERVEVTRSVPTMLTGSMEGPAWAGEHRGRRVEVAYLRVPSSDETHARLIVASTPARGAGTRPGALLPGRASDPPRPYDLYGGWRGGPSEVVHELGHDDARRRLRPLKELGLLVPEGRHAVGVLVGDGVVHVATSTADPAVAVDRVTRIAEELDRR
jgi:hypothetical protein